MKSISTSETGEEGGFCKLLREVQEGRKSEGALFEDETFRKKLASIINAYPGNAEDRADLESEVRFRVWRSLATFVPNYTLEFGGFFAWVRRITKNRFLDSLPKIEIVPDRSEELPLIDNSIDTEGELLFEERVRELRACIAQLPERERIACTKYILEGFSSRETAEALTRAGYSCSHTTALKWVSKALKPYFPHAEGFSIEEIERKANKRAKAQIGNKQSSTKEQVKLSKKKAAEP